MLMRPAFYPRRHEGEQANWQQPVAEQQEAPPVVVAAAAAMEDAIARLRAPHPAEPPSTVTLHFKCGRLVTVHPLERLYLAHPDFVLLPDPAHPLDRLFCPPREFAGCLPTTNRYLRIGMEGDEFCLRVLRQPSSDLPPAQPLKRLNSQGSWECIPFDPETPIVLSVGTWFCVGETLEFEVMHSGVLPEGTYPIGDDDTIVGSRPEAASVDAHLFDDDDDNDDKTLPSLSPPPLNGWLSDSDEEADDPVIFDNDPAGR